MAGRGRPADLHRDHAHEVVFLIEPVHVETVEHGDKAHRPVGHDLERLHEVGCARGARSHALVGRDTVTGSKCEWKHKEGTF